MRMHGLMQAFSRTNRILNKTKTHGNIVAFRPLEKFVDQALALFADKNAGGLILIKSFKEYYHHGYENERGQLRPSYKQLVTELKTNFDLIKIQNIYEFELKVHFIKLFGQILKLRSILLSFDEFNNQDLLSRREIQNYLSHYHNFYDDIKQNATEKESIVNDVIFETDLTKTYDTSISYLIEKIKEFKDKNLVDHELMTEVDLLISSSGELRSKRKLIREFINTVNNESDDNIFAKFDSYRQTRAYEEINQIVKAYSLNYDLTVQFLNDC